MVIGQAMAKKTMLALLPPFYRSAPCCGAGHQMQCPQLQHSDDMLARSLERGSAAVQDLPAGSAAAVAAAHAYHQGAHAHWPSCRACQPYDATHS